MIDGMGASLFNDTAVGNMVYNVHIKHCTKEFTFCSGPQYKTEIGGQECTVEKLLEELYQKAAIANLWSLVRHTAGMLRKSIENLGAVSLAVGELMICFSSLYCFRLPLIC